MKTHSQSGFSAVEALLIIVILGILGFTGYFVYHSKQSADKNLASSNMQVESSSKVKDSDAVQKLKFSTVPADLRTAILARYKALVPACVSGDTLIDSTGKTYDPEVSYVATGFAKAGSGCSVEGAGVDVYYKESNSWRYIPLGQSGVLCTTLRSHDIPDGLVSDCLPSGDAAPVAYKN